MQIVREDRQGGEKGTALWLTALLKKKKSVFKKQFHTINFNHILFPLLIPLPLPTQPTACFLSLSLNKTQKQNRKNKSNHKIKTN